MVRSVMIIVACSMMIFAIGFKAGIEVFCRNAKASVVWNTVYVRSVFGRHVVLQAERPFEAKRFTEVKKA